MIEEENSGVERRDFIRLDYVTPLAYKVCSKEIISKLLKGYTTNISQSGLFCNIKEEVKVDDILWLSFDRSTLGICKSLEKMALIYQGGIIGKVVRLNSQAEGLYGIGVRFITREEQDSTNSYLRADYEKT